VQDDLTGGIGRAPASHLTEDKRALLRAMIAAIRRTGDDTAKKRRLIGILAEMERGSDPTERRHFDFGDFLVIGVPDGLTSELAKEFGSSRYLKETAHAKRIQANAYAVLWGRPRFLN
jgi:hypothetical protein